MSKAAKKASKTEAPGGQDEDLWGRGARQWLRILRAYVRKGRFGGRDLHRKLRGRFAQHWGTLETDVWRPLMTQARERGADLWGRHMIDWRCGFLAIVTETAYWWAWDIEDGAGRPQVLRNAVVELRKIDLDIQQRAGDLVAALERRRELREDLGIDADWTAPGVDLWDLLESVANMPQFTGTCLDSEARLETFLSYMRGTSRCTPELEDLLGQLAMSLPGEPYALNSADAEVLLKSQGAGRVWSERTRMFMKNLEEQKWQDGCGRRTTALDCFTPATLSLLLTVAAGFDPSDSHGRVPPAFGATALGKTLQRHRAQISGAE